MQNFPSNVRYPECSSDRFFFFFLHVRKTNLSQVPITAITYLSATLPISPPSASTSCTNWDLAGPPTAGLHGWRKLVSENLLDEMLVKSNTCQNSDILMAKHFLSSLVPCSFEPYKANYKGVKRKLGRHHPNQG